MDENQALDEQGNSLILSLERKSVQPFRTQDEYLYAMKEDLAEWFNTLYSLTVGVDDFFEQLETGVVICQHANKVQDFILEKTRTDEALRVYSRSVHVCLPDKGVQYRGLVKEGSFQCRDNISNFISWCRGLGIPDCLLFETDDLVMRKNERNVVLCLLEVARRGAKYGMQAPMLIQLEQEIDAELEAETQGQQEEETDLLGVNTDGRGYEGEGEEEEEEEEGEEEEEEEMVVEKPPPPPKKPPVPRQRWINDLMSLDELVRHLVNECTCPDQFPIIRVSEGKYKIGESLTLIFVRVLRNHVMVRIGGGWDTLENYLDRHDPCRCKAGHKASRAGNHYSAAQLQAKRRASAPSANLLGLQLQTKTVEKVIPQEKNKSTVQPLSPTRRVSVATSSPSKNMQRTTPQRPASARARAESPATVKPAGERRRSIPTLGGGLHKNYRSATDLSASAELSVPSPAPKTQRRPSSAREGNRRMSSTMPTALNVNDLRGRTPNTDSSSSRGRSREKDPAEVSRDRRSRSIGAPEMRRQLGAYSSSPQFTPKAKDNDMMMISRDSTGRHKVGPVLNGNANNPPKRSNSSAGSTRKGVSPNSWILPSKPKGFPRSQSLDVTSPVQSPTEQNGRPTFSLAPDLEELPDPEADAQMNRRMELLFEEYRRVELGLPPDVAFVTRDKDSNANPKDTAAEPKTNAKPGASKTLGPAGVNKAARASPQRKLSTGGVKTHSRTNSTGAATNGTAAPTGASKWRKERTPSPCLFERCSSFVSDYSTSSTPDGRLTSTSSDVSLDMMSLSSTDRHSISGRSTPRGRYGSSSSEAPSEAPSESSDASLRQKGGRTTPRSNTPTPRSTPIPNHSNSSTPHASPQKSRTNRSKTPTPQGSPRAERKFPPRSKTPTPQGSPKTQRRSPIPRSKTPTPQGSPKIQRKASTLAVPATASKAGTTRTSLANAPWKSTSTASSPSVVSSVETSPEKELPESLSPSFLSQASFTLSPANGETSETESSDPSPVKIEPAKGTDAVSDGPGAITKADMSVKIAPITFTPNSSNGMSETPAAKPESKVAVSYDGAWEDTEPAAPAPTPAQPKIKKPVQKQQTPKAVDQRRNSQARKPAAEPKTKAPAEVNTPQRRNGMVRSRSAIRSSSISRMRTQSKESLEDTSRPERPQSARGRAQHRENGADNSGGRRSRADLHNAAKNNTVVQVNRAENSSSPPKMTKQHRSKSVTNLFPNKTQLQLTIQVDEASVQRFQQELDKIKASPRRDDRVGPRSRIPMPVDVKRRLQKEGGDTVAPTDLKRFDSGVDINNFSPTDNSMQGDEEQSIAWPQEAEAVEVTAYTHDPTQLDTDDYY